MSACPANPQHGGHYWQLSTPVDGRIEGSCRFCGAPRVINCMAPLMKLPAQHIQRPKPAPRQPTPIRVSAYEPRREEMIAAFRNAAHIREAARNLGVPATTYRQCLARWGLM